MRGSCNIMAPTNSQLKYKKVSCGQMKHASFWLQRQLTLCIQDYRQLRSFLHVIKKRRLTLRSGLNHILISGVQMNKVNLWWLILTCLLQWLLAQNRVIGMKPIGKTVATRLHTAFYKIKSNKIWETRRTYR